jgi:predicted neuraminidase
MSSHARTVEPGSERFRPGRAFSTRWAGLLFACAIFGSSLCGAGQDYQEFLVARPGAFPSAHAATITLLPGGHALCCWYAGSEEHRRDVQIYCSRWDDRASAWSAPVVAVHRQEKPVNAWLEDATLANPALFLDRDGRLWLFYSATTMVNGWSAAHVEYKTSRDGGSTWSESRRLTQGFGILSRGTPLLLDDGRLLVPLYEEFLGRQSVLCSLRLRDGRVVSRTCSSVPGSHIQPALVRFGGSLWAYMRVDRGERILRSRLGGDGEWESPSPIDVPNPDSSLDVALTGAGGLLLACNPSRDRRTPLSLLYSADGVHFSRVADIEAAPTQASYPSMARSADGLYHLVYTYGPNQAIKHVRFSEEWLVARLRARETGP